MMHQVVTREVVVANPQGLHARPADLFTRLANCFESTIEVMKEGQRADGKSILDILMLAAPEGTRLEITARGADARQAVDVLAIVVEKTVFAEEIAG
jgi:phosphotransferase system HPr (HPr) family protein